MDDLVTERLVLHPLSPAEAERVAAGEPAGRLPAPGYPAEGDMSAARRYLTTCAITGDPRPYGTYEIRLRADGTTIGGVDFHGAPDEDGTVSVGYGLVPSARGQGYASESLRGLLEFARARGVLRVRGDTDHDNTASQRVMRAVGMRLVSEDEKVKYYQINWSCP
ncbi:acetyltransferase [Streptomyces sp. 150FB]|uniref:GNAT family N-acetyltransferase n=1 Tax=Streptomyces sp. 150FB TaxID=1576605 RepID=UPI0005893A43|nr:GNAT family N-acetyltransferase [Streptomyces sp. 150FB]KIF78479.1 acetyltransferase [Streptomyces sp. 150FB]